MSETASKLRLFFALWPPAALQASLGEAASALKRELGGKATQTESIHLTLVFLGEVVAARLDEILAVGQAVRWQSFALDLDRSGCFKHNRIAWVGPSSTPAALSALVAQLQAGVRALGFTVDDRPYTPHITLVRKALRARGPEALSEVRHWPVESFVLIRSELGGEGSKYSVVREWGWVK